MSNTVAGILLGPDTHANRPAASAVTVGSLYACSDHDLIYQSDGSSWGTWIDHSGGGGGTPTFSGARVSLTADESTTSATALNIPWDQADYDTDSYWSAGNPTRLTIQTTGYHLVTGSIVFPNTDADGERFARLRENGTTFLRGLYSMTAGQPAFGSPIGPTIAYMGHFTSGDYIEVQAYQDSGSALSLSSSYTFAAISLLGT